MKRTLGHLNFWTFDDRLTVSGLSMTGPPGGGRSTSLFSAQCWPPPPPIPSPTCWTALGCQTDANHPQLTRAGARRPGEPLSHPLLAGRGDIGTIKCWCVDMWRPSLGTCGCSRAMCEIGAPASGQKVSRCRPPRDGLCPIRTLSFGLSMTAPPGRGGRSTSLFPAQCWPPAPPIPPHTCSAALECQNTP